MALSRILATNLLTGIFQFSSPSTFVRICGTHGPLIRPHPPICFISRTITYTQVRCAAASDSPGGGRKKTSSRMSQVHQLLNEAEERAAGHNEPIPKITLDHVSVSFARSGGPGGQNVNKGLLPSQFFQINCILPLHSMPKLLVYKLIFSFPVNTKVDMRFNIKEAYWLSDRVGDKILQMEKNRINKDGELVISSTKTRTQKGNIEDALEKLQEIINAASYVPPPPSQEQVKKINKIAAISEAKRLQGKKVLSQKKALRRSRDSYD
ncbi:hypothetical protein LXL04_005810 [Taraxacum kok-saghyz]